MTDLLRVLIVDDEPLARKSIRLLLGPDATVAVVGECPGGTEALAAIRGGGVDLVFLDIQMPGMSGFEVLAALDPDVRPLVIFVTAFDQYAVRAFEVHSLDYLLKPFDDERFAVALGRAKAQYARRDFAATSKRLVALLEELKDRPAVASAPGSYPERFAVRSTGRVTMVPVDDIDWFEADGDYARFTVGGKQKLLRETFGRLEERLDPTKFVRIHRSYIVRIGRIRELRSESNGDYRILLHDGTTLPLSRTYREHVLALLERPS